MEYNPHTGTLIERPKSIGVAITILWVSFSISIIMILIILSQVQDINPKMLAIIVVVNALSCLSLAMAAKVLNQREKTSHKRGTLLVKISVVIPLIASWLIFGKPNFIGLLPLSAIFLLMGKNVKNYYEGFK